MQKCKIHQIPQVYAVAEKVLICAVFPSHSTNLVRGVGFRTTLDPVQCSPLFSLESFPKYCLFHVGHSLSSYTTY